MGFLHGIKQIGEYYELQDQSNDLGDIQNFLQYPLDLPDPNTPDDRKPLVIRVSLQVEDCQAESLRVTGIKELSLAEYPGMSEDDVKAKYLYREPVGANVTWTFSPIYKLGKGLGDLAYKSLIVGEKAKIEIENLPPADKWGEFKDGRLFKLYHRILKGFEESGCFSAGSADLIMSELVSRVDELIEKWQDKKRSYLMVFGVSDPERTFLFPGDLPACRTHFKKKISVNGNSGEASQEIHCSLCQNIAEAGSSFDKIFKFSTFDKSNFLPGQDKENIHKTFPVCKRCYTLLSRGKTEVENRFSEGIGIPKYEILVIPEIIGSDRFVKRTLKQSGDYFSSGVEQEKRLFEDITKRDASFVYHFMFIEQNQAQIILHRLVEDIPPTQFKKIKNIWAATYQKFYPDRDPGTLDQAIRRMIAMILSLSGKSEIDKLTMKDRALNIVANLFNNEWIDVSNLQQAAVTRLPGLFSDDEWLNDKNFSGGAKLEQLNFLFDFLFAVNRHLNQQDVEEL
jgi:CRISPR-associated protein Csh1